MPTTKKSLVSSSVSGSGPATLLLEYNQTKTYQIGEIVTVFGIPFVNKTAVSIAESFDPAKWTCLVRTLKSGALSGGTAAVNGGDATLIDLVLTQYVIVDNTDPSNFLVTPIEIPAQTFSNTLLASPITELLLTISGNVLQQAIVSIEDELVNVRLGRIVNGGGAGLFFASNIRTVYSYPQTLQVLLSSAGGQFVESVTITPGSSGLTLDGTTGKLISQGQGSAVNKDRADISDIITHSPVPIGNFFKVFITTGNVGNSDIGNNFIDPDNYNPSATSLEPVPAGKYTVQRVYVFGTSSKASYYGRTLYNSLEEALQSFDTSDDFIEHPVSFPAGFSAHIIVRQGITDWSDPTTFKFIPRLGGIGGSWDRGIPKGGIGGLTPAQKQAALAKESTGVISGGIVTLGAVPATQISQAAGNNQVADHSADPFTLTLKEFLAQSDINLLTEAGADLTKALIYVSRLEGGSLELISTDTLIPTSQNHRDKVLHAIIRTTFGLVANEIRSITNKPLTLNAPMNQLQDGFNNSKIINDSGNTIEAANSGVNLTINKLSGIAKGHGINAPTSFDNPNKVTVSLVNVADYRIVNQNGETTGTLVTTPEVSTFDNLGVSDPITGNNYQIMKLWLDPVNNIRFLQKGTIIHSATDIDNGLHLQEEAPEPALLSETCYVIARLVLKAGTTTFDADSRNTILQGSGEAGTGGGAGAVATSQLAYEATSVEPEILTNTTRGAFSIQRGTDFDSNDVFEILNGAGAQVFSARGDGTIRPRSFALFPTAVSSTTTLSRTQNNIDTSAGSFPVTLPASPVSGFHVRITDTGGSFGVNNLTVNAGGTDTIQGAASIVLGINDMVVDFHYNTTTDQWAVTTTGKLPMPNGAPSDASLDNGQHVLYVDEPANIPRIKFKNSAGVLVDRVLDNGLGGSTIIAFWDGRDDPSLAGGGFNQATLGGDATYDSVNDLVELTPNLVGQIGNLTWQVDQGAGIKAVAEFRISSAGGADAVFFFTHCASTPNTEDDAVGGYIIALDEFAGNLQLLHNGVLLDSVPGEPWANNQFHTMEVIINYNIISVSIDGINQLIHQDVNGRDLTGQFLGFGARTGGVTNKHDVRRLELYKGNADAMFVTADGTEVYTPKSFRADSISVANSITEDAIADGPLAIGDVLIVSALAAFNRVGLPTQAIDKRVVGVALTATAAAGDTVRMAIGGEFQVRVTASTGKGDFLRTSATLGRVDPTSTVGSVGDFAIASESATAGNLVRARFIRANVS